MSSVTVICVSTSEKVVSQSTIRVSPTATIADLKNAMNVDAKKAMQVHICGAVPSESALIGDLASAYANPKDGLLHVNYSIERSFGASFNGNLTDGCAGQC